MLYFDKPGWFFTSYNCCFGRCLQITFMVKKSSYFPPSPSSLHCVRIENSTSSRKLKYILHLFNFNFIWLEYFNYHQIQNFIQMFFYQCWSQMWHWSKLSFCSCWLKLFVDHLFDCYWLKMVLLKHNAKVSSINIRKNSDRFWAINNTSVID